MIALNPGCERPNKTPLYNAQLHGLTQRHLDGIASEREINTLSFRLERSFDTRLLYLKLHHIPTTLVTGDFQCDW